MPHEPHALNAPSVLKDHQEFNGRSSRSLIVETFVASRATLEATKRIEQLLNLSIKKENLIMADLTAIQAQNAALVQEVADQVTVEAGAITLIEGQGKILTDLQAQLASAGTDQAALQAVSDSIGLQISTLSTSKNALAAAVAAGTPAASTGTGTTG